MGISKVDFLAMQDRLNRKKKVSPLVEERSYVGVDLEDGLHEEIMALCNRQWPPWVYIRARMDKKSTIQKAAQDFTIFLPGPRTLCVECKSRTGKRSPDQLIWAKRMERVDQIVHEIRSLEQFKAKLQELNIPFQ